MKFLINLILVFATGGLWLVVMLVWYLTHQKR